jgi:hypothetical protein
VRLIHFIEIVVFSRQPEDRHTGDPKLFGFARQLDGAQRFIN